MNFAPVALVLVLSTAAALAQATPEWIWHPNNGAAPGNDETRYFRKTFQIDGTPRRATIDLAADNHFVGYVNGQKVGEATGWNEYRRYDIARHLKSGENVVAVEARNEGGAAGLIVNLDVRGEEGSRRAIVSDSSWQTASTADSGWQNVAFQPQARWVPAKSLGKLGVEPWGNIAAGGGGGGRREQVSGGKPATPAESITVLDGFKVELLRSAQAGEGSWVAMTLDPKGRLIVSPQGKEPMLRVTLDARGQIANLEKLDVPISGAMGLLYAFDALYINGQGAQGYHLYRVRENSDGKFGEPELLRKWKGGPGEHGAHGIVLGPDNLLYIVNGNFVDVPEDILPTSPHRNYADDVVLPRMEDGNGFGAGRKPPGGYVVRVDKDGKNAELFASGQRNTYDIAFNADGELFGFDSDMEWDWGSPWYRPTRAYHIVSGGDQGFREGSAKWPEYYADSLPATVNIGIGSPTGVMPGKGAKFPAKFQKALYMMDWSYGRILAVHLTPRGSSYTGTFDTFVKGKPLNVTDMVIGPDGAMYFATGGRGTQAGLYRVSYTGQPDAPLGDAPVSEARKLRHQLEAFHGKRDPKAVDFAWPHLNSADRFIRYAARIAIESQPLDQWKQRALDEREINASITALLALARYGSSEVQEQLISSLGQLEGKDLDDTQVLEALRVIEVSLARHGRPGDSAASRIAKKLEEIFPADSWPMNRELSQILVALDSPGVVKKALDQVAKAETQEEQLHYVVTLRKAKSGWTIEDRKRYFSWFQNRSAGQDAGPTYPAGGNYFINASTKHPSEFVQWFTDVGIKAGNGASYNNFIKKLKTEVIAGLNDAERAALGSLLTAGPVVVKTLPQKEHKFVREWKMSDFADSLNGPSRGRSFESGREAFAAAQCFQCHRFANEGGAVGPDLSGAGSKYSRRDLLESILESSRVISDQYQNTTVTTKDGDDLTGRIVEDTETKLVLVINALTGDKMDIRKSDVKGRAASKTSPMPDGLVNILTKEEILDLLAYIESAGNKEHAAFRK